MIKGRGTLKSPAAEIILFEDPYICESKVLHKNMRKWGYTFPEIFAIVKKYTVGWGPPPIASERFFSLGKSPNEARWLYGRSSIDANIAISLGGHPVTSQKITG